MEKALTYKNEIWQREDDVAKSTSRFDNRNKPKGAHAPYPIGAFLFPISRACCMRGGSSPPVFLLVPGCQPYVARLFLFDNRNGLPSKKISTKRRSVMAHTTSASARPQIAFSNQSVDKITLMAVDHMTRHALAMEDCLAEAISELSKLPGSKHDEATKHVVNAFIQGALVMNSVCMLFPGEVMALRAQNLQPTADDSRE